MLLGSAARGVLRSDDTMGTRDALHALIDEIPDDDLALAQDALEVIRRGEQKLIREYLEKKKRAS